MAWHGGGAFSSSYITLPRPASHFKQGLVKGAWGQEALKGTQDAAGQEGGFLYFLNAVTAPRLKGETAPGASRSLTPSLLGRIPNCKVFLFIESTYMPPCHHSA